MSINNVRAVGDDRPWKDEVERELKKVWDALKYGKISLRAVSAGTGGGGGGGADLSGISASLPATYDTVTYTVGVDQDTFDHISNLDYAQFDTTTAATRDVGRLMWNDTDGTLEFGLKGGNVTLQIGQEQVMRVRNNTGSTLVEGTVCYFNGSDGTNFNVTPAVASADPTSAQTMGVLTETLNTSTTQHGFLTTFGLVRNIDISYISGLADGDQLYLDPTTAGRMTKTKPVAPGHLVYVGICLSANGGGSNATIFVKVQNGYELGELHDVDTTGATTGQVLQLQSDGIWKPSNAGAGTVSSITAGTGLTGGTITTTGTIALADTAVTVGSYGSASAVGTFTVDQQGRLTSAGSTSIAIAASQITSGTLPVSRGGTGATNFSVGRYLKGNGTSAIATQAGVPASDLNGTVAIANGGTAASTIVTARANLDSAAMFVQSTMPNDADSNIGDLWTDSGTVITDGQMLPSGTINMWATATAPGGWLICDGSAISRTTYANLFAVLGTTYGTGDGSTTFNIPNLQGRIPVGKNAGTFATLGGTGGAETVTLTPQQSGGWYTTNNEAANYGLSTSANFQNRVAVSTTAQAHTNLQPYIVLNYIIKA